MRARNPTFWLLGAAILLGAPFVASCSAAAGDAARNGALPDGGQPAPDFRAASVDLANRDIRSARNKYEQFLAERPNAGRAAAGKAITDLLLLPGSEPVVELLRNHLGARGGFDAQSVIYEKGGYLYWLKKGATWTGRGDSDGIKDVLADRLPWDAGELESLSSLTGGLENPVGESRGDLVRIAGRLGDIQKNLRTAIESDNFERIVVPGETFRDLRLTLKLGKSELATVAAAVAAARGLTHYLAAYRHQWSLEEGFARPCEAYDGDPGSGWKTWDCTLKFLDARWFRALVESERADRLADARKHFDAALFFAKRTIDFGLERRDESTDLTFDWRDVDPDFAKHWRQLIVSLRTSLQRRTTLPFTVHPTENTEPSADLSSFFDNGRTLNGEVDWLLREDSETDDSFYWRVGNRALQGYFVEGIFDPRFDVTEGENLELGEELDGPDGERLPNQVEELLGKLSTAIDNSYLSNR